MPSTIQNHVADNEHFVLLVKLIKEDSSFRSEISKILDLDERERRNVIDTIIEKMKNNSEPGVLIEAFSYLKDTAVAFRLKEVL